MQSTGAFIAVSRYASATPVPPSILSRGVGWQVLMEGLSLCKLVIILIKPESVKVLISIL